MINIVFNSVFITKHLLTQTSAYPHILHGFVGVVVL